MTGPVSRRATLGVVGTTLIAHTAGFAGDFRYMPSSKGAWPQNLVRAIQSQLQAKGFDPGPIDGFYGARTAEAIRAYQVAEGKTPDGTISQSLIESLGLAPRAG